MISAKQRFNRPNFQQALKLPCRDIYMMRSYRITFIFILILQADFALCHSGATDFQGGHVNRESNEYHCHREPCFKNRQQVKHANQKAKESKVSVSLMFNREDWPHWIDEDDDCQDTRAEILLDSSLVHTKFGLIHRCSITWGVWLDPYADKTFFNASTIDIDHIVPLAHAHRNGADNWPKELKQKFANDPINLIAVDSSSNRSKSDQGPNEWMPPRKEYWCEYLKRWEAVKEKYGLNASIDETRFVKNQLIPCKMNGIER